MANFDQGILRRRHSADHPLRRFHLSLHQKQPKRKNYQFAHMIVSMTSFIHIITSNSHYHQRIIPPSSYYSCPCTSTSIFSDSFYNFLSRCWVIFESYCLALCYLLSILSKSSSSYILAVSGWYLSSANLSIFSFISPLNLIKTAQSSSTASLKSPSSSQFSSFFISSIVYYNCLLLDYIVLQSSSSNPTSFVSSFFGLDQLISTVIFL